MFFFSMKPFFFRLCTVWFVFPSFRLLRLLLCLTILAFTFSTTTKKVSVVGGTGVEEQKKERQRDACACALGLALFSISSTSSFKRAIFFAANEETSCLFFSFLLQN